LPPSWSPAAAKVHNYGRSTCFLLCSWNNDCLFFYYCCNGFMFGITVISLIMAKGILLSSGSTFPYITLRAVGELTG
jgi:hypothetical protein